MKLFRLFVPLCLAAVLTAAMLPAGEAPEAPDAQAPEAETPKVKREVRKVIIRCDGDDCDEARTITLGDGAVWIGDHECEHKDCAHAMHLAEELDLECEGDKCDENVFVYKTHGSPMAWHSKAQDFAFVGGSRAFLGVQFLPLTEDLASHFGSDADKAVMVSKVVDDSPASLAGLEVGDVISAVDGEALGRGGLPGALHDKAAGDEVSLDVLRNGRSLVLTAVLDEREMKARFAKALAPHAIHGGEHKLMEIETAEAGSFPGAPEIDTDELCAGLDECEVRVECEDDDQCTCEVNGEAVDCP